VHDKLVPLFSEAHVAAIERFLKNEAAYAVLIESLGKLEGMVREAKDHGYVCFKSHTGRYPAFPILMCFADFEGGRWNRSISFRKAYEKSGDGFDMLIALNLKAAVESLILSVDGIEPMRRRRRRR
jgi:hypothetical protein